MDILEMYAEMEEAIKVEMENGLNHLYDKEDAEEDARLKEEYDSIFESNYSRKADARVRHHNSLRDKERRNMKSVRKANAEKRFSNRQGLDNGHYYLSVWNERGFYNTTIIEKKANRKRKHTLADDIAEYEKYLAEVEDKVVSRKDMRKYVDKYINKAEEGGLFEFLYYEMLHYGEIEIMDDYTIDYLLNCYEAAQEEFIDEIALS